MPARWKNINDSNRHEQLLVRMAMCAYSVNHGVMQAAIKFGISVPTVYYWWHKQLGDDDTYYYIYLSILKNRDYETYVIFD